MIASKIYPRAKSPARLYTDFGTASRDSTCPSLRKHLGFSLDGLASAQHYPRRRLGEAGQMLTSATEECSQQLICVSSSPRTNFPAVTEIRTLG